MSSLNVLEGLYSTSKNSKLSNVSNGVDRGKIAKIGNFVPSAAAENADEILVLSLPDVVAFTRFDPFGEYV